MKEHYLHLMKKNSKLTRKTKLFQVWFYFYFRLRIQVKIFLVEDEEEVARREAEKLAKKQAKEKAKKERRNIFLEIFKNHKSVGFLAE